MELIAPIAMDEGQGFAIREVVVPWVLVVTKITGDLMAAAEDPNPPQGYDHGVIDQSMKKIAETAARTNAEFGLIRR